jgi:hypothetical protein
MHLASMSGKGTKLLEDTICLYAVLTFYEEDHIRASLLRHQEGCKRWGMLCRRGRICTLETTIKTDRAERCGRVDLSLGLLGTRIVCHSQAMSMI